jgi:hypothetical protein
MTTRLDNILVPQAVKQIAKYGKLLTYVRRDAETYDVATAKVTRNTVSLPIKAIVEDYRPNIPGLSKAGLSLVLQPKDKLIYIAAGNFSAPNSGDQITIDDETFTVPPDGVGKYYSGDLVCLWLLVGRKA